MSNHYNLIPEHFIIPERNPNTLAVAPPFPTFWHPAIYLLYLWIYLFWTFNINEVIQYVAFCDCLISLSIIFSRFIHIVVCSNTSFLSMKTIFCCMDIPFYFPISSVDHWRLRVQNMPHKACHINMGIILSWNHLKNSRCNSTLTSLFFLKGGHKTLCQRCPLYIRKKKTVLSSEMENQGQVNSTNTS